MCERCEERGGWVGNQRVHRTQADDEQIGERVGEGSVGVKAA